MTDNEKFPGGGPAGSALTPITGIVHGNKKKKKEGRRDEAAYSVQLFKAIDDFAAEPPVEGY